MELNFRSALVLLYLLVISWGCSVNKNIGDPIDLGIESRPDAIIQGVAVQPQDPGQKAVVMILSTSVAQGPTKSSDFSVCTGVLIAENIALTAAHCVKPLESQLGPFNENPNADLGLMGFASAPQEIRRITGFLIHEKFAGESWKKKGKAYFAQDPNDLALVYFAGKRPETTQLAKLASDDQALLSTNKVRLYGYGYSRYDESELAERDQAISKGRENFIQTEKLLTAERDARLDADFSYGLVLNQRGLPGICYGDSGGPAFIRAGGQDWLVGINTHRAGLYQDPQGRNPIEKIRNECQYDAVLTRPALYREWIQAGIEILKIPNCESQPLFRSRIAELLRIPTTDLQIDSLGQNRYLVKSVQAKTGEQYGLTNRNECKVPSNQGLFALRELNYQFRSDRLRKVFKQLGTVAEGKRSSSGSRLGINKITVLSATDRLPTFTEQDGEYVLQSLAAQEELPLVKDAWLFDRFLDARQTLAGTDPIDALTSQNEKLNTNALAEIFSSALKQKMELTWIVANLERSSNFRQEIWIRDAATHEILIWRQIGTGD